MSAEDVQRWVVTTKVLQEVASERERQDDRWGVQDHPDGTEESIENFAAMIDAIHECNTEYTEGRGTWLHILREETAEAAYATAPRMLREELVQIAAVCVAWIECIDRRTE